MATPQLYYKNGNSWQSAMLNSYPVGAIYSSTSSTNPGSIFGGGWAEITGAVLRGNKQGGVYSDGDEYQLTVNQIPSHNHRPHITYTSDLGHPGYGLTPAAGFQGYVIVSGYPNKITSILDPTGGGKLIPTSSVPSMFICGEEPPKIGCDV